VFIWPFNMQSLLSLAAMPVGDWQFWAVSLIALGAVLFLARPMLRKARGRDKEKRATLTIGGKAVEAKKHDEVHPRGPDDQAS